MNSIASAHSYAKHSVNENNGYIDEQQQFGQTLPVNSKSKPERKCSPDVSYVKYRYLVFFCFFLGTISL